MLNSGPHRYSNVIGISTSRGGPSRRYFAVSNITDRRSVAFDTAKDPDDMANPIVSV
jgi:hypothetical protein